VTAAGYRPTEAQFQAAVVELARMRHWLVMHIHDSRRSLGAGFPDLCLVNQRTGELLFAELKTHAGRVSQAQQKWIDALALGGHVVHVWRPSHMRSGQIVSALTSTAAAVAS
jgi:hypothetical protein